MEDQQSQCCTEAALQWSIRVIDRQYAELCYCNVCGKVHHADLLTVPLRLFPLTRRCISCGGQQENDQCGFCGLTVDEDQANHAELLVQLSHQTFLDAALGLCDLERVALALKMSSAEIRWGDNETMGRIVRLQALEALGERTRALNEAYDWVDNGGPLMVWGIIADLEVHNDNIEGAIHALERGLQDDPENTGLCTDYAELMSLADNRPSALHYATKGLHDTECLDRCVKVIHEVAERFFADGKFNSALTAVARTGTLQERYVDLAWLRARIFAVKNDRAGTMRALETVLTLDPNHKDARHMAQSFRTPQ
ncbi:MAG: hypothetical protein HN348_31045 [Proteobacteria bacterium]|nr:hypothetical protein [Pseudomonadota bacterium]